MLATFRKLNDHQTRRYISTRDKSPSEKCVHWWVENIANNSLRREGTHRSLVASIIQLNLRRCTMPMKNLSVRRPLWSSTQKFRHSQDSRSMLAIPVDGGKGEGERVRCSGIERDWEVSEGGQGGETRNGRADQALRRDGFGFEGWHTTWKEGVEGSEVGWAISEPSVAQWLTGAIQPTAASPLPFLSLLLPRYPLSIHLWFLCVYTRMPYSAGKRNRHALPLIRISAGRLQCSPVSPRIPSRCICRYPEGFSAQYFFLFPLLVAVNYFLTCSVEWKQVFNFLCIFRHLIILRRRGKEIWDSI